MAKVEIDEAEFLRLSKLNNFVHAGLQNPEAARLIERASKIIDPNIKTPRLDQDAAIQTPLQKMQADMTALSKKIDDDVAARTQNQTLAALNKQRDDGIRELRRTGWTDDGIKAVEKLMDEKGILDVEIAAAYHEKQHPPQAPAMPGSSGGWNFMESVTEDSDKDLNAMIQAFGAKDEIKADRIASSLASKALTEVRSQARR
jgi:hypothetical protein